MFQVRNLFNRPDIFGVRRATSHHCATTVIVPWGAWRRQSKDQMLRKVSLACISLTVSALLAMRSKTCNDFALVFFVIIFID